MSALSGPRRAFLGALALAIAVPAPAARVERVEIRHHHGRYEAEADLALQAPAQAVRRIALDHDRLYRLSDSFTVTRMLERIDERNAKRRLDVHSCVLVFCFDFTMVESVEDRGDGEIVTTILPDESDFRGGESRWRIDDAGNGTTVVRLRSYREPKFWVPPLIGPLVLRKKMRDELITTAQRLEQLALEPLEAAVHPAPGAP